MSETQSPASGLGPLLEGPERAQYERLRHAWHVRIAPLDEAERMVADSFAAQAWRSRRLDALEERVMRAMLEGRPLDGLPSPSLLLRWRARLERDRRLAVAQCEEARRLRPADVPHPGLNPERLEWLGRRMRERWARAEAERVAAGPPPGLDDPEGVASPEWLEARLRAAAAATAGAEPAPAPPAPCDAAGEAPAAAPATEPAASTASRTASRTASSALRGAREARPSRPATAGARPAGAGASPRAAGETRAGPAPLAVRPGAEARAGAAA